MGVTNTPRVSVIDSRVPRTLPPAVNFLENVYLYNIDDLQSIAADYLKQRREEIVRCEEIIAEKVKPLLEIKSSAQSADENKKRRELSSAPFPSSSAGI